MKIFLVIFLILAISACVGQATFINPTSSPPMIPPTSTATLPVVSPQPVPTKITPTILEPTPTSQEEASPLPASPGPSPVPQPAAPARLTPGNHLQLDEIHMVSRTAGWGIRGRYLLTTADGGQTWREVTPAVTGGDKIYGAFLNAQDAWIVFATGDQIDSTLTVYFTTNGGRTWSHNSGPELQPNVTGERTWIEFAVLDSKNIWFMARSVYLGAGTHFNHELFRSTDGGNTWTSLDGQTSDDYTGMVFSDASFGLRTLQTTGFYAPGPAAYDATTDGGANWENRPLPPPPDAPDLFTQYPYCETYQPVLLSAQSIRMLVGCFDEYHPPRQFDSYLYASQDGGTTWTAIHLPGDVQAWQNQLVCFGPENVLVLGRELYASADGGQTWTDVATVNWDGQFSFIDPQNGWAVASANGQIDLVRTSNGGRTWSEVNPIVTK